MLTRILLLISLSAMGMAQTTTTADNKPSAPAPNSANSAATDALSSAKALLDKGKLAEAAAAFKALVDKEPASAEAQAGLMRSLMRARKFDDALAAGTKAVAAAPSSALVHATFGDVNFRAGQLSEAEQEYRAALSRDANSARGIYGMGKLYSMLSMGKHAKEAFTKAHELDPNDRQIFYSWVDTLPRTERAGAFKKGLEKFGTKDEDENNNDTLKFYDAIATKKPWVLIHEPKPTEVKMQPYGHEEAFIDNGSRVGMTPISKGYGLQVKFNDRASAVLLLDTGAPGIIIGEKLAERAGVTKIAEMSYRGVGEGTTKGYLAWADKITIGGVEFQNCIVEVSTKKSIGDDAGLVGPSIFDKYLVTLDFRDWKLNLTPLPKHPEATGAEDEALDRYIAPEMQSFSKVYNFEDHLVLLAVLGTAKRNAAGLFMLDTGAFANTISIDLARKITKVYGQDETIEGVSAKIKQVFSGDKVYLHFAGIHVVSTDIAAFDHSSVGGGAEISGFIGIRTLVQTKLTIDYRDGLVKVEPYESKPL